MVDGRAGGEAQLGRTGDDAWSSVAGWASVRVGRDLPLEVVGSVGHSTGQTVLDQWTFGGSPVSVWPDPATAHWLADPALPALVGRGSHFDRLEVSFGSGLVRGFATRTRIGEGLGRAGMTVVGIQGGTEVDADPFALVSADGRGTIGVGRTVEHPDQGWSWSDGRWVAFASWTWR